MAITNKALADQQAQDPIWAVCPSCGKERQVIDGQVAPHRRWSDQEQRMQACPGVLASTTITFSG